jgi:hypothetical protein
MTIIEMLKLDNDAVGPVLAKKLQGYLSPRKGFRSVTVSPEGHWVYAIGTIPMCLVAHYDTLARYPLRVYSKGNVVHGDGTSPLGADDRAGCFAILDILRRLHAKGKALPSVLLTNGEESGGTGVINWLESEIWAGKDWLFVELDRANANEYVHYSDTLPKPVRDYIEGFGFVQGSGTYSDIADISDELLVPSVNLSIGYYRQHSALERLHLDELAMTIRRVLAMIQAPIRKLYRLKPSLRAWHQYSDNDYLWSDDVTPNAKVIDVYDYITAHGGH